MRRSLGILFSMIASSSAFADPVDDMLRKKETMVGAIAMLIRLPPNCAIDNRPPTTPEITTFAVSYGYKPDDELFAAVKTHLQKLDEKIAESKKLPPEEAKPIFEALCASGKLYSVKVKEKNR